ncbi:MAG: peptide ABC transporter substrate-binding protein, partial [Undibacterium sp.]|nr:peptide ABC transporter substrate-binding protein [Opitutaceae bacterium]
MSRLNHALPFALACALALTTACSRRETLVQAGNRQGILHVGNGAEVQYLDPHIAGGQIDHNVLSALFEGLVTLDEETLQPRAGAAASWEISPEGLVYTFHLRPDAQWSNGDPLTTRDFLYSFRRALSPALASEYKDIFYPVKNAEAYAKGTLSDFSQVGFRALDATTLQIILHQPVPYFLTLLRNNVWFPVHAASVEKTGAFDDRSAKWTQTAPFVCNGPFRLREWRVNQHLVVEKNPHYWDAPHVRLNEIWFYPSESLQSQEFAFRAGQLHTTWDVPLSKLDAYRKDSPGLLRIDPIFETYFVRFNVGVPAFKDPRVRRAFALTINREAIVKNILRGGQLPATGLTPPGIAGYTPPPGHASDADEARRLLAEAGYPGGRGLPKVEFLTIPQETQQRLAEALQERWRRELGVEVVIIQKEFKMFLAAINDLSRDYTFARGKWTAEYADPLAFISLFTTGNGVNG